VLTLGARTCALETDLTGTFVTWDRDTTAVRVGVAMAVVGERRRRANPPGPAHTGGQVCGSPC
jgi:hypothetical protein